jgi:hypothetical protein
MAIFAWLWFNRYTVLIFKKLFFYNYKNFIFFIKVIGYSITNVMSFTIFSKLLGPKPQGK